MKRIAEGREEEKSYKATMWVDVYEDDFNKGEGRLVNNWENNFSESTLEDLISEIEYNTDTNKSDWMIDNMNNYPNATEVWASQLVDANNVAASNSNIENWKNGEMQLYSAHYQILISSVGTVAVPEDELKRAGVK